jgi:hypothetical protein
VPVLAIKRTSDPWVLQVHRNRRPRQYTGQLRLTHSVLDLRISPLAKLIPAAVEYFRPFQPSYRALEGLLPAGREAIPAAIREAEEAELVTVARPTERKRGSHAFDRPSVYALSCDADPASVPFTILRLPGPDRTPGRWILRAVYEREQARRGAVSLPDVIAAQRCGISPSAVRQARESWKSRGDVAVLEPGRRGNPAVLVLTDSPYAARPESFERARYAVHGLTIAGDRFDVWASSNQVRSLRAALRRNDDADLARAYADHLAAAEGSLVDAARVFRLLGGFDLSASALDAGARTTEACPDPIPF